MKKILVLYASAGSGHKKAAEGILAALKARGEKQVEIFDIIDFMPFLAKKMYREGYILTISRMTRLWGILYYLSDTPWLKLINVNLRKFINAITCFSLIRYLVKQRPDVIVSTQFLASELVSYAKEKAGLKSKLITVVTDFGVHNFWITSKTDIYCCASESTKKILIEKGIPDREIKITGIPLDEKFTKPMDRNALLSEFGLKKDLMTVLIATGGIGVGPIEEIVSLLQSDFQVLVVCGNNKKLYQNLEQKKYPNVRLFGFVDYMQKLMKVADVLATKAGGLSVTEGLAMGLPLVFFYLIPGQEMINAQTLDSLGAGKIATKPSDIRDFIMSLKKNPELLQKYRKQCLSLAKPHSTQEVISLV
jgi:processive 1,2-diacylglycerol beta-glucosyltransferase